MQSTQTTLKQELWSTLVLAAPLSAAFAGNHLMGLVDTAIMGRLGAVALAGTATGATLFFIVSVFGMGILFGLEPFIAQAIGAGEEDKAYRHYREGIVLSLLMCIPLILMLVLSPFVLPVLKFDEATIKAVQYYVIARAPGLAFMYMYRTSKAYLQANHITRPMVASTIIANILNVFTTAFLAMGDQALQKVGLPAIGFAGWGVFGAGISTTFMSCLQWLILRHYVAQQRQTHQIDDTQPIQRKALVHLLRLGWPLSIQYLAEGGLVALVTLLMGQFGPVILSGHQIALQLASFTFVICVGFGSATTVRVGHAAGKEDRAGAQVAGIAGLIWGVMFMSVSGMMFYTFPKQLAGWFAVNEQIIEAAVPFMLMAAIFQVVDGIQAVSSSALRGIGDIKIPALFYLASHWCIGLPLSWYLTFGGGEQDPVAMWWGLIAGLSFASVSLCTRFFLLCRKPIKRML